MANGATVIGGTMKRLGIQQYSVKYRTVWYDLHGTIRFYAPRDLCSNNFTLGFTVTGVCV